jgi:GntR family transcriptional regulator, transcriptional repressor for pyruvate dehydrogenase complex
LVRPIILIAHFVSKHMAFLPTESRRLYRQIAEQVVRLILSGEFPLGARLPSERDLAERLKVSRPSVREALIALEVEGIVEVRLGSGVTVIAQPHQASGAANSVSLHAPGPFDVIRARQVLESECAALAATHASEHHLDQMRQAVLDMRSFETHSEAALAADQRFHQSIAEASGNSALLMLVQQLWVQRTGNLYMRLESHFTGNRVWGEAQAEHEQLLDAILSRDPHSARMAMIVHMKNAEVRFASAWRVQE